jgi:hypothetical protein
MTNYSLLLEDVISNIWNGGEERDVSLHEKVTTVRARMRDAKVDVPHDMPGITRRLFDKGAVARGGVINGRVWGRLTDIECGTWRTVIDLVRVP